MYRYIIIGSGVAGVAAIQAIRQVDASGSVLIISDDPHGYYSRPGMAYYLTGEVSPEFLFPLKEENFRQLGVHRLADRVTRILPFPHGLECLSGRRVDYERLLIATGSTAAPLEVPGSELAGVLKLDNLEDARRIINLAHKGRTAVVVGGGITALELVEALAKRGVKVHLFLHGAYFWHSVLEKGEARLVEERLEKEGVKIHPNTDLTEITGRRGKVEAVTTRDGLHLRADIVAVAVGVRPVKNLAEASGLNMDRGILVDQTMQTNQADIFAAGDVAQVYDPVSRKWIVESLWGTALTQGRYAGWNMAGAGQTYVRGPAFNVTRLAGVTTAIIGAIGHTRDDDELLSISHGDSESWRDSLEAIVTGVDYDLNHLRVMVGERTITGAVVMGDQSLTPLLKDLITRQVDISPIRSMLVQPKAAIGPILKNYYDLLEPGHEPQRN